MSFNIELAINIISNSNLVILTNLDITNWDNVILEVGLSDEPCNFYISYDGHDYEGIVYKNVGETQVILEFTDNSIVIGSGQCIIVDCDLDTVIADECVNTNISSLNSDTRLMIVDDNGCPEGYITLNQLLVYLEVRLGIPADLCDLLGGNIPQGNLTGSDRILTTSGTCTLKSVPQSDLACP